MSMEQKNKQVIDRSVVGKLIHKNQIKQFIECEHLSDLLDLIDKQILSYLDTNTILNFALAYKNPWYPKLKIHTRVLKELQDRNRGNRVTVYTWAKGASSIGTTFRRAGDRAHSSHYDLGHSALRTWVEGERGEGVYVSFYPGDHPRDEKDPDYQNCDKSDSHFHTWEQESKNIRAGILNKRVIATDLYGLNVQAINQAFRPLHDKNMNSLKPWAKRYNCSDIVLDLLEKGGIHQKISLKRYGCKTIWIFGSTISCLALEFLRLHPTCNIKWGDIFWRGVVSSENEPFSIYHDGIRLAVPATIASLLFFCYGILSFRKYGLPLKYYKKQVLYDSIKVGLIGALFLYLSSGELSGMINRGVMWLYCGIQHSLTTGSFQFPPSELSTMMRHSGGNNPDYDYYYKTLKVASIIPISSLFLMTTSPGFIYNTTTTPKHVLNVSKEAKTQLNNHKLKTPFPLTIEDKIRKNKYMILGGFATLATAAGLFALHKNSQPTVAINQTTQEPKVLSCHIL